MPGGRAVFRVSPEKQLGLSTIRKCSSNTNIITTEDNKIHIHLGLQFKKPLDSSNRGNSGISSMMTIRPFGMNTESKETAMGTVLRSPRHSTATTPGKTTAGKGTSSITITPVTSSPARPTQSVSVSDGQSARPSATRIPVSKGMKTGGKAVMGVSTVTQLESRAESQSMKIELRKSAVCSSVTTGGGKA